MTVRVEIAPDVLQWAVERAGWDAETVRQRVGQFDEWVTGAQQPTLKQAEKFANDTHTPFGLLFLSEPPHEDIPIPDMRTVRNVGVGGAGKGGAGLGEDGTPKPSGDLLDTIYLCQDRQDWYRTYALESGIRAPEFVGSVDVRASPVEVAERMRELLGFTMAERAKFTSWEAALRGLIELIENAGVLVMISGIVGSNTRRILNPEEFRGFALSNPVAPLIFVNGRDTKAAQIFTLVHELAHIWLGASALSDASMVEGSGVGAEQWCNQVAAEVLVPLKHLRENYAGDAGTDVASTEELERLAKQYRVSTLVVLKRLFDAGFLPRKDYRKLYEGERHRVMTLGKNRKKGDGGNFYNTQLMRLGRPFTQAVITSTLEGTTSYREAFSLLGTKQRATFDRLGEKLGVR